MNIVADFLKRLARWILLFLLFLLLLSCSANSNDNPKTLTTPILTTDSGTPVIQAVTEVLDEGAVIVQCLDIQEEIPDSAKSESILVLDSRVDNGSGKYKFDTFYMDMSSLKKRQITLSNGNLEDFAVSPDRKLIAYNESLLNDNADYLVNDLVIATADNRIIKRIPEEANWGVAKWINNQELIVKIVYPQNIIDTSTIATASAIVINPFTEERRLLEFDFPALYNIPPLPNWDGWDGISLSSTLDMAVYLKYSDSFYYVLWDINAQKEIASYKVAGDLNPVPRWSPDDQQFAFSPNLVTPDKSWPVYELYGVNKDGKTTQLVHLLKSFPWVYIADLSWSPDGKHIAFWFSYWLDRSELDTYSPVAAQRLAVLDLNSNAVIDYCIPGETTEIGVRTYPPPLWSPDGRQVLVQSQISKNLYEDSFNLVLVDIPSHQAYRIDSNLEPVGWIK